MRRGLTDAGDASEQPDKHCRGTTEPGQHVTRLPCGRADRLAEVARQDGGPRPKRPPKQECCCAGSGARSLTLPAIRVGLTSGSSLRTGAIDDD